MARTPTDLVGANPGPSFEITMDGSPVTALPGQSVAAALWAAGILAWRTTRVGGRPRGRLLRHRAVLRLPGHRQRGAQPRACLVPARPGDVITTQEGHGHDRLGV